VNGGLPARLQDVRIPIPFSCLSIQFTTRKVTLHLRTRDNKRHVLVEATRSKDVLLETTVEDLIVGLREAMR
jgi:hypothetical protein